MTATLNAQGRLIRRTDEAAALVRRELEHRGHAVLDVKRATLQVRAPSGRSYTARVRSLSTAQSDWIIRTSDSRKADVWILVNMLDGTARIVPESDAERLMTAQNERLHRPPTYMPQGIHGRAAEAYAGMWRLLPG